jgi:hypothetical protein
MYVKVIILVNHRYEIVQGNKLGKIFNFLKLAEKFYLWQLIFFQTLPVFGEGMTNC